MAEPVDNVENLWKTGLRHRRSCDGPPCGASYPQTVEDPPRGGVPGCHRPVWSCSSAHPCGCCHFAPVALVVRGGLFGDGPAHGDVGDACERVGGCAVRPALGQPRDSPGVATDAAGDSGVPVAGAGLVVAPYPPVGAVVDVVGAGSVTSGPTWGAAACRTGSTRHCRG